MTQSLIWIGLFLCALLSLPFLIEHLKKRYGLKMPGTTGPTRLVSALSLGPNQKVVTVEVGPANARVWLVLGVTPQAIACLHTTPAETAPGPIAQAVSMQAAAASE